MRLAYSWLRRGSLLTSLGLRRWRQVVLRLWYLPEIDDELIPDRGEDGHRDPQRLSVVVECSPEDLEHAGVVLDPEEARSLSSGVRAVIQSR